MLEKEEEEVNIETKLRLIFMFALQMIILCIANPNKINHCDKLDSSVFVINYIEEEFCFSI